RNNSAAYVTSAPASVRDLPFSFEISAARSSWPRIINSNARCRTAERSRGGERDHPLNAAAARSTALVASLASWSAICSMTSRDAGSRTSNIVVPVIVLFLSFESARVQSGQLVGSVPHESLDTLEGGEEPVCVGHVEAQWRPNLQDVAVRATGG